MVTSKHGGDDSLPADLAYLLFFDDQQHRPQPTKRRRDDMTKEPYEMTDNALFDNYKYLCLKDTLTPEEEERLQAISRELKSRGIKIQQDGSGRLTMRIKKGAR
jgi:hypothetical protein